MSVDSDRCGTSIAIIICMCMYALGGMYTVCAALGMHAPLMGHGSDAESRE